MGKLLLARHHESEWNKLGLWTGLRDRHLTEYGFKKSEEMGLLITDFRITHAFASMQVRSIETLSSMLTAMGQENVPTEHTGALNERDYGDYTGKSKWNMKELIGDEQWNAVRREWDCPVPHGETLKMVSERVLPYFKTVILPYLEKGNVLVVAHGNSCRSLLKYIERISDKDIREVEMPFGSVLIYELDKEGHMTRKDLRQVPSSVNA